MDIVNDIQAAIRRVRVMGEQPTMIHMSRTVFDRLQSLRNPSIPYRGKGTHKTKKKNRFYAKKRAEWIELLFGNSAQ